MSKDIFQQISKDQKELESRRLSPYAEPSSKAIRRKQLSERSDRRPQFARDADRILHSLAYSRYIDKTQVFYRCINDHITHRVLHVQFLSRIARDIGSSLGLNLDLIEAIAIGHDVGHAPLGHLGESILQDITKENGLLPFQHNVHSVRLLTDIERWNLCMQTYDGILCHDGEIHQQYLEPEKIRTWEKYDEKLATKSKDKEFSLTPTTLEACVVRFSDTISYVGRDIEDAIILGLIKREDIQSTLGNNNGDIIWSLVNDLIENSYEKPYIAFSKGTSKALKALKEFNYQNIYATEKVERERPLIKEMFFALYEKVLGDLEKRSDNTKVFGDHINLIVKHQRRGNKRYSYTNTTEQIALDFIAGMTDDYFVAKIKILLPSLSIKIPKEYMTLQDIK